MSTTPQFATAAEAYAHHAAVIQERIKTLQALLVKHAEIQQSNPESWAYGGDLALVASMLEDAVNFMSDGNV